MSSNVVLDGLDPDARQLLDAAQGRPPMSEVPLDTARAGFAASRRANSPDPPEVAEVRDLRAPGPAGEIPLRLYRGAGTAAGAALPGIVYFHGGGWVVGDLESHDPYCRLLANAAGAVIVAVDYRLAPEHPYPAAVDDGDATLRYVAAHAAELGIDPNRMLVVGDSAGGNVAAVVAFTARDAGMPLVGQILVYPVVDATLSHSSYERVGAGFTLTRDGMAWFCDQYVPNAADRKHPRVSPLFAESLRGLPPTIVATAGHDPLCDEGAAYARRLEAEGVPVRLIHYPGQMHGFAGSGRVVKVANDFMAICAAFITTGTL
jgi:acetyl esterase